MEQQYIQPSGVGNVQRSYDLVVTVYDKASFFTKFPPVKNSSSFGMDDINWELYGGSRHNKQSKLAITTPIVGIKLGEGFTSFIMYMSQSMYIISPYTFDPT